MCFSVGLSFFLRERNKLPSADGKLIPCYVPLMSRQTQVGGKKKERKWKRLFSCVMQLAGHWRHEQKSGFLSSRSWLWNIFGHGTRSSYLITMPDVLMLSKEVSAPSSLKLLDLPWNDVIVSKILPYTLPSDWVNLRAVSRQLCIIVTEYFRSMKCLDLTKSQSLPKGVWKVYMLPACMCKLLISFANFFLSAVGSRVLPATSPQIIQVPALWWWFHQGALWEQLLPASHRSVRLHLVKKWLPSAPCCQLQGNFFYSY